LKLIILLTESDWRNTGEKKSESSGQGNSQREWPSGKQNYSQATSNSGGYENRISREAYSKPRDTQPEWLDDDGEENSMTFDPSGKFISVKELKEKKKPKEESDKKEIKEQTKEKEKSPSLNETENLVKVDEDSIQKSDKSQEKEQLELTNDSNSISNKLNESDKPGPNILKNSSNGANLQQQQEDQKILTNEVSLDIEINKVFLRTR